MKKVLIIVGLALIMIGCNSPLKKSVITELTTEELKTICDKDPSFLKFYEECCETPCYQQLLSVKSDQVAYAGVTYKEFYNYYRQVSDEENVRLLNEKAEKEWADKFGYTEKKFDSIIGYWQNYYKENSPETYLDIEFDHAALSYSWSDFDVALFFRLTPKRDAFIHSVVFEFTMRPKDDESQVVLYENSVGYYKDFQAPIIIDKNHYFFIKNDLYNDLIKDKLTYEELLNKYDFEYEISYVETEKEGRIDFDELFKDEPEIGSYIEWFDRNSQEKDNIWKEEIIRKHIDENYYGPGLFFETECEKLNPTCYDLMHYLKYCKYRK